MPPKKKFYAVKAGKNGPIIYDNWSQCQKDVSGYSGAIFKSFGNLDDAKKFAGLTDSSEIIGLENNNSKTGSSITGTTGSTGSSKNGKYPNDMIHIKVDDPDLGKLPNYLEYLSEKEKFTKGLEKIREENKIILYTDGSCTNIGKPNAIAGSGIYFPDFNIGLSVKVPGKQTNNRGELWATCYGIVWMYCVLKMLQVTDDNNIIYEINTDSTYTQNNLVNNGKVNLDLCQMLKEVSKKHNLEFKKVPAHSGDINNDLADELAKYFVFYV